MDESILRTPDLAERDETEPKTWGMASNLGSGMVRLCAERHGAGALAKLDLDLPTVLGPAGWGTSLGSPRTAEAFGRAGTRDGQSFRRYEHKVAYNLLQPLHLYRSGGLVVAELPPYRKSPAMLSATRAAEALTESRARCA